MYVKIDCSCQHTIIDNILTDIPTTTFSRLRIQFWELSWSPPKDCTSISGPLKAAKIDIRGISNNVKGTNVVISIKHESINLYNYLCGAEQYIAKIYALREISHPENNSAYEEYKFETPAKGETLSIMFIYRVTRK